MKFVRLLETIILTTTKILFQLNQHAHIHTSNFVFIKYKWIISRKKKINKKTIRAFSLSLRIYIQKYKMKIW